MKHFTFSEFDSPDAPGSGENMNTAFLEKLDMAREMAGVPFIITSGYRTVPRNLKVGGTPTSSHLKGIACDIACATSEKRWAIIDSLLAAGFTRVGISSRFIHVDDDPDKPRNVIWTY